MTSYSRGQRLVVTGAHVAPHHFTPGTQVRFVRASSHGDRFLVAGPSFQQWLAAEDLAEA